MRGILYTRYAYVDSAHMYWSVLELGFSFFVVFRDLSCMSRYQLLR